MDKLQTACGCTDMAVRRTSKKEKKRKDGGKEGRGGTEINGEETETQEEGSERLPA